jgi:2,3-bisphosphoglycerate-independent phosphoglycerate mutase
MLFWLPGQGKACEIGSGWMRNVVLIVQDGWGIASPGEGNYISQANTPNFDRYVKNYPHCRNQASGNAVGLPEGAQGNSEVGHLHMGAGRIVWQMYERINRAIGNGKFFKNKELLAAIKFARENKSTLHLIGMCSDEGVHSHTDHLFALLEMAKKNCVKNVAIHFIADGRDVPEKSAREYAELVEKKAKEIGIGKIASVVGRYYAMDRDHNWDRTRKVYDLLTLGKGFKAKSALEAIEQAYERGDKTDYYIQPTVIKPFEPVQDKDSVIFFNFRIDRPRQLTKAFVSESFNEFERKKHPKLLFTTISVYDKTFDCPAAFIEEKVENNLGKVLSKHNLKQLRLAETEKYGHVSYFFNSQVEKPNKGEKRVLVPSPKVPSYDQKPEMSAFEVAETAVKEIEGKKFNFVLINFANCDLVGHSAVKEAIIKCVEVVDECTEKVVEAALENGYEAIVTADHGSAEEKLYPDGKARPAHSVNPVNFILVSNDKRLQKTKLRNGGQKDVAPTVLDLMGIKKPKEMTGKSLLKR